jgi:hypothetical protein
MTRTAFNNWAKRHGFEYKKRGLYIHNNRTNHDFTITISEDGYVVADSIYEGKAKYGWLKDLYIDQTNDKINGMKDHPTFFGTPVDGGFWK